MIISELDHNLSKMWGKFVDSELPKNVIKSHISIFLLKETNFDFKHISVFPSMFKTQSNAFILKILLTPEFEKGT